MYSKTDLEVFLSEISEGMKILKLDFVSAEKFTVQLKCKVEKDQTPEFYGKYSGEWIKKFSKFTATAWIVRHSFPKMKRLVYRKIFACHRSGFNKTKKPTAETRNQECKAKIDFRIRFINRNTIKNDQYLREGLNLTITVDFLHTHKVRTPDALNLLRNTSDTDQLLAEYYEMGCAPAAAQAYQELTLIDKYGENSEILSNATVNPPFRSIHYFYEKKKKDGTEIKSFQTLIEMKKDKLESKGFTIIYENDPEMTVIVSPLMKRVATELDTQTLQIDSTTLQNGTIVTYYYALSKIGALPIACIIHTGQDSDSYFRAFVAVKKVLDIKEEPKIIFLNNFKEQKVVSTVYTKAKIMKSRYVLCREIWILINDDENRIEKKKRHEIMAEIKSLIYSTDEETAHKLYSEIKNNDMLNASQKLSEYLSDLWSTKEDWFLSSQENNNDLVAVSIRLTKEFLKKTCKLFNNIIMINIVTNILENQNSRTMMSYVRQKNIIQTYTNFMCTSKKAIDFESDVKRVSQSEYKIDSGQKCKRYFYLRTDTMFCDCKSGKKGQMCDHLCAIINVDETVIKTPNLSQEENETYTRIVGEFPDESTIGTYDTKPENCYKDKSDDEEAMGTQEYEHYDENITHETQELDAQSNTSSPKSENNADYFYLEVKSERCDPLEDESHIVHDDNEQEMEDTDFPVSNSIENNEPLNERKNKYETALKVLNDEFRRLNRFFSENPNSSNLATMISLSRELSKVRPVEKVNLKNIVLKPNRKRKHNE